MVTFDSRDRGTGADAWRRSDTLLAAPAADDRPFSSLLVVAAHPDDETLMAGGLIARFARSGRPVTVVIASDGEASHPNSPTHGPEELAAIRAAEVATAVARLAPAATLVRLELPDGEIARHEDVVADAVRSRVSDGTLVVSTWEGDGHPDHEAVARAARGALADPRTAAASAHWQAPIWLWHWGDGEDGATLPPLARIALSPGERAAKTAAAEQYPSQTAPLSERAGDEALLSPEVLEHFAGDTEFFVIVISASGPRERLGQDFFEEFYSGEVDPWGFEVRWYERRKRDLTLAVLPRKRFATALELGCSIGVTTAALADRCDDLLALDIVEEPLRTARKRLAGRPRGRFERRTLPEEWPPGRFDLIVLSEVGYYLDITDLRELVRRMRRALTDDGVLVACHWRHPVAEYPLTGDAVHEVLLGSGLERTVRHVEDDFLLEVFQVDPRSVAQRNGLA